MADTEGQIFVKRMPPGVVEFSGPELLLRMIEQQTGVTRPEGKAPMDAIAEIEQMAEDEGPNSVLAVQNLKGLTQVCLEYVNEAIDRAAPPVQ